jgi:hypothetical protein
VLGNKQDDPNRSVVVSDKINNRLRNIAGQLSFTPPTPARHLRASSSWSKTELQVLSSSTLQNPYSSYLFILMSAPQIPNLNTLRRGGGRAGRPRGRGGLASGDHHGTGGAAASAKDRVVQNTDNDASVSRLSAVELGYLEDPFATALTTPGPGTRRFPIINRGEFLVVM